MYYIDTSAAMKLIVAEANSKGIRRWLRSPEAQAFSSDLLRTEFLRATRRSVPEREPLAREILESILMIRMSVTIYDRAAMLEPRSVRSLDALHLAAATEVGDRLEGIVTYDERLATAARDNGVPVIAPQ